MAAKFGTSGLRGLVEEIRGDVAIRFTRAFAIHLKNLAFVSEGQPVFVAWDLRQSSPSIAADAAAALKAEGLLPVMLGALPTPVLALLALENACPCVMITGSHIPDDRNGIKYYLPNGEIKKSDEVEIASIAARVGVDAKSLSLAIDEDTGKRAIDLFMKRCALIAPSGSLSGIEVGVYEHSTVGREMLKAVLQQAGAEVVLLGREKNFIALDTEDVAIKVQSLLKQWSAEHRLDAIVSADGDADRPLVADENGRLLRGDVLGLLTSQMLHAKVVATPVTSSSGIESALQARVIRTCVGSPYVIAAMEQAHQEGHPSVVGFEANGGFLVQSAFQAAGAALSPLPTRDAFLPILATLKLATEKREKLSSLVSSLSLPISLSTRLENISPASSSVLLQQLQSNPTRRAEFISTLGEFRGSDMTDGCKMTLDGQRTIHLRPSGNAPELRIYVEAPSLPEATMLMDAIRNKLMKMIT
jgi:phosphomannomutase